MANNSRPIKVLALEPGGKWDSRHFKLKTGWVLRFTLSPRLYAQNVQVCTDYPAHAHLYKRGVMRSLPWFYRTKLPNWDPDRYVEIELETAGAFRFEYKTENSPAVEEGSGYFVVDPDLGYSPDSISCQTHITKLLGPLSQWKQRLAIAKECGYNMLHFTPIQQLGSSRSAYSISNQLKVDSSYLPSSYTHQEVTVPFTNTEGECKELRVDSALVEVRDLLESVRKEWGILSIVDVVWNHTSFDTPWLIQHPEAGYNLLNSPHFRPSYCLDVTINQFSREIVQGKWEGVGIHSTITSEGDIHNICSRLMDTILPRARLSGYFCVDVDAIVSEFRSTVYRMNGGNHPKPEGKRLKIVQDSKYRRLGSGVDSSLTLELFNIDWPGVVCFEERIERCCAALRDELRALNREVEDRVQGQLWMATTNLQANMRYQFLEGHGPQRTKFTEDDPMVPRYFCVVGGGEDLRWDEMETPRGEYVLAHNGWIMNADPLVNFAAEGSQVYFQRELIVWGDSIKLRYGHAPSDSPWLWEHMKRYTQSMAWMFDGFRLDNCHNTPLNVAEGLLDAAREVNPNLYLVAELFSGSEDRDNLFVNRLGINSLIREAMSAHTPRELGRLVYKYGGVPVASFLPPPSSALIKSTVAHSMFVDATHDNDPGHILSRSVDDALPNTALVAIASCASGSCRGYDELVPHQINVVTEARLYSSWRDSPAWAEHTVDRADGIIGAKVELNALHKELAEQGFNEIYVDQVMEEIVAVTRHSPSAHQSVILMAHTAFRHHGPSHCPPLTVPGAFLEIVLEACLVKRESSPTDFSKHTSTINGLQTHELQMQTHIPISQSRVCHMENNGTQEVHFDRLCPGTIIIFRVSLSPEACHAVQLLRSFLGREKSNAEGAALRKTVEETTPSLSLLDLNYALYRCDSEERDDGNGGGTYVVPGAGALVYCGLQGVVSMLASVRDNNDLGHPICDNLRAGDWLMGYTVNRLRFKEGTRQLADMLSVLCGQISVLPRYLIPCYFEAVVTVVHSQLIHEAIGKMGKFIQEGSSLVQQLALGSVQLYSTVHSAQLPPIMPGEQPQASMAAGLPHFATGHMRCWGRDTFIAFRGLLLTTTRYQEARETVLSFATCVRHGLLPNLLSGGTSPRYNCRDAPLWWLQSIQDFCRMAPNGYEVLQEDVRRLFRQDDAPPNFETQDTQPLSEIMQEVLQRHMDGIEFRERGAGISLDKDMTPPGFNVRAGIDTATGFVFGGSVHNCGTWMDKVGESSWAGNKGVPATPRDGSAVELVGLCYSTVSWLSKLYQQGVYPYSGVKLPTDEQKVPQLLTFTAWAKKLREDFEEKFWIPADRTVASEREGQEAGYIHRTGIYKDCVGATQRYSDFQLRPNFPLAMVVAPDLFTPENAWEAITNAEKLLLGPLGMKTLDPADYVYNGYYINSVDSPNYNTAHGFNYHQGPEWLWVVGYFLRAKLQFARSSGQSVENVISSIHRVLSGHAQALHDSPWKGLPELTNRDGAECADSCPVQAWSMACLLDVLFDLQQFT